MTTSWSASVMSKCRRLTERREPTADNGMTVPWFMRNPPSNAAHAAWLPVRLIVREPLQTSRSTRLVDSPPETRNEQGLTKGLHHRCVPPLLERNGKNITLQEI